MTFLAFRGFHAFAPFSAHLYITISRVLIVYLALVVPSTCISPSPRLLIQRLSLWLCFLGNPSAVQYPVDTCSVAKTVRQVRTTRGYSVPDLCFVLSLGLHSSPGLCGGVTESNQQPLGPYPCHFWPKPIIRVGLFNLTTIR